VSCRLAFVLCLMWVTTDKVQRGHYLFCSNGGHMPMYDDQKTYVDGGVRFVRDVDQGRV